MPVSSPVQDDHQRNSKTILIVEDDEALLEAFEMELTGQGFSLALAKDGLEAIEAIQSTIPDLIITDLAMPRMNGALLIQHIRREPRWSNIPILIVSAYGYEWEAELMPVQGHLRKPVRNTTLDAEIRRLLRTT